jgi:hypothetical protein
MCGYDKKDSCCVPRRGTAGCVSGVRRARPPSQGYEGQAAAERRGQAAACMQELQPMHSRLSAPRSKEPGHDIDVSDSSGASHPRRRAAGEATHGKGKEDDGSASSAAPPRSTTPGRVLSTAGTQEARSGRTDRQPLHGQARPPAAGPAEADKRPDVASKAGTGAPPLPRPPAAAAPVAGPLVQASYLSALAGGLQAAAAGAEPGLARRGEAGAGVEAWRAGAGGQAVRGSRTHARGGAAPSVDHTRVALQGTAGRA